MWVRTPRGFRGVRFSMLTLSRHGQCVNLKTQCAYKKTLMRRQFRVPGKRNLRMNYQEAQTKFKWVKIAIPMQQ
jgi:hypothetical protein